MSRVLTDGEAAELMASGRVRVTWLDDDAGHQIRITGSNYLSVTCVCRQRASLPPLEIRTRWDADDALAVYRAHLAEVAA